MCGVLSLSTLSPSSYHGLRAGVEYGSADTFSARASYYGKTSRGLAIGGGVSFKHSDGFYTNAFNGDKCDPYDGLSLRFRIEKSLRPDLYFENIISAGTLTQGGWPYRQYISASEELLETSYNDMCSYRRFNLTEAMKLRLEGENYTLNSISIYLLLSSSGNTSPKITLLPNEFVDVTPPYALVDELPLYEFVDKLPPELELPRPETLFV
jgi:hypothetical protein